MTTNPPDRLDRIEQLLEALAIRQGEFQRELEPIKQIADSNARSNQANSTAIADNSIAIAALRAAQSETLAELRASVEDIIRMLTTQANEAAADRAELRRMIEAMYGQQGNANGSAGAGADEGA